MNRRSTAVALASAVTLALGLAAGPAVAQTKLKWAHVYETSEPFHTRVGLGRATRSRSAPTAATRSTVFPASQLGKETDINQGLTLGTVDIIISGSSFAARSYPPIGVTYFPSSSATPTTSWPTPRATSSRSWPRATRRRAGTRSSPSPITARANHREQPIKTCADMKGLKIRVPDVPAYLAMPRACGANTTPIAFAEVYLALQNGTVEAQENPLNTIEAKKFYEVQKHIVLTGHIVDHLNTVVSKQLWDKLSRRRPQDLHRGRAGGCRARDQADPGASRSSSCSSSRTRACRSPRWTRHDFIAPSQKNVTFEQFGYRKDDWDRIQAIQ